MLAAAANFSKLSRSLNPLAKKHYRSVIEDMDTQIIKHRVLVSDVVEQHREIREEIVALRAEVGAQSVPVAQPHPPPAVPPDAPSGRADVDRMCVPDAEKGNET